MARNWHPGSSLAIEKGDPGDARATASAVKAADSAAAGATHLLDNSGTAVLLSGEEKAKSSKPAPPAKNKYLVNIYLR
jgi:hypothetical protein